MSRRRRWAVGLTAAVVAAGAGLLLGPAADVPPGPEPGRSLYRAHCASCHGADARGGSWRARLLFLRPGDLTRGDLPDPYVRDIVRHGGTALGKPGMPSFGFYLSEADIEALVAYLHALRAAQPGGAAALDGREGRSPSSMLAPERPADPTPAAWHAARPSGGAPPSYRRCG